MKRHKNKDKNKDKDNRSSFILTGRHEMAALAILFFIAFFVRMLTYNSIFVGDHIRFLEFDTYYHMRRAVSFALNFPHIWDFDTYLNYPYGTIVGWPPLYDWAIALIANIIGLGNPGIHLVETVGAYFPVFIGSLSVVVIYFISKEIFSNQNIQSWKIGIMGGLLLAIIPAFTQVSFLGFVDHHVAEVLLSSTVYLFFIKALKAVDQRERIIFSTVSGFVLSLAVFTWLGTPIFIGIILIYGLVQSIVNKKNTEKYPVLESTGFLVFSTALLFTVVIYLTYRQPLLYINSGEISFFHIGLLLASASIFGILRILYINIKIWYIYIFTITGIILISYTGLYLFFPGLYVSLNSGLDYLIAEGTVLQQIKEAQPLFFIAGKFTWEPAWYAFNTAFYIGIAGLILVIIKLKNKSLKLTPAILMFLVWTLIVFILNLYQTRFIYLFSVNLVILCAYLITELSSSNKTFIKITGAALLITILISSIQINSTMVNHPLMLSDDWFVSLEWLRYNTPDADHNGTGWIFPQKDQKPSFGVMSWWDYGNYILYLSKRPVIANNFQIGAEDSARFYTSENESEANAIMDKRKAKYVIVDYRLGMNVIRLGDKLLIRGTFGSAALLSEKNLLYYLDNNSLPNDKYFNTMYARLYLFDGKGLNNYKLIYKSQTRYPDIFNKPIEEIKIFEYTGSS